jgi:hypothetical protein
MVWAIDVTSAVPLVMVNALQNARPRFVRRGAEVARQVLRKAWSSSRWISTGASRGRFLTRLRSFSVVLGSGGNGAA